MRLNPCDAPFSFRFAPDCLHRAFLGGAQGQQVAVLRQARGFRAACFVHALGRHAFCLHACARRVRCARFAMPATGMCSRRPFCSVAVQNGTFDLLLRFLVRLCRMWCRHARHCTTLGGALSWCELVGPSVRRRPDERGTIECATSARIAMRMD